MGLIQKLKKTFFREKLEKDPRINYDFDEEDREKALLRRQANKIRKQKLEMLNTKLRTMKQKLEERALIEQISDIENDLYDDDEEEEDQETSTEDMIIKQVLQGVFNKTDLPPKYPGVDALDQIDQEIETISEEQRTSNEEEIRHIVANLPLALKGFIKNTDNTTLNRIVQLIKVQK